MHETEGATRELIDTGADKRYARRDTQGKFNESADVGRSLAQDQKRKAARPLSEVEPNARRSIQCVTLAAFGAFLLLPVRSGDLSIGQVRDVLRPLGSLGTEDWLLEIPLPGLRLLLGALPVLLLSVCS